MDRRKTYEAKGNRETPQRGGAERTEKTLQEQKKAGAFPFQWTLILATVEIALTALVIAFAAVTFSDVRAGNAAVATNARALLVCSVFWVVVLILLVGMYIRYIDLTKRREAGIIHKEQKMQYLAEHDELTGLYNRHKAIRVLEERCRPGETYSICLSDIRDFREVNEIYGRNFGDRVLISIADGLKEFAKQRDVIVSRYGNDEFLIIFLGRHLEKNDPEIEQIRAIFQRPVRIGFASIDSDARVGIANSDGVTSPEALVFDAEIALNSISETGDTEYCMLFSAEMKERTKNKNRIKQEILREIRENDLYMVYQPKVSAETLDVVGYEALVRASDASLTPGIFIPIAEKNGWLREIGRMTTRMVIEQLAAWRKEGKPLYPVSINFSGIQIRDTGYFDYLMETLRKNEIPPYLIEIEITESVVIEHRDITIRLMNRFHDAGIRLLMDDFGTGYSSLSYLAYLPLDVLKVDKSLVDTYLADEKRTLMLRDVIKLGHDLGMEMLIEGVETEDQFVHLKRMGADTIQGYYFSRPLKPSLAIDFRCSEEDGQPEYSIKHPAKPEPGLIDLSAATEPTLNICVCDWNYSLQNPRSMEGLHRFLAENEDVRIVVYNEPDYAASQTGGGYFSFVTATPFDGYVLMTAPDWPKYDQDELVRHIRAKWGDVPVVSVDRAVPECIHLLADIERSEYNLIHAILQVLNISMRHGDMQLVLPEGADGYIASVKDGDVEVDSTALLKVAFVESGEASEEADEIHKGFLRACDEFGIPEANRQTVNFIDSRSDADRAIDQMIASGDGVPSLIACSSDSIAGMIADKLQLSGIYAPEDVIICGFEEKYTESDEMRSDIISVARGGRFIYRSLSILYAAIHGMTYRNESELPYILRDPDQLVSRIHINSESASKLRSELRRYRKNSLEDAAEEQRYKLMRDGMESDFMDARSLTEIMDIFEHYTGEMEWEHLYLAINNDYHDITEDQTMPIRTPDKMVLTAITKYQGSPEEPDPVSHVYEIFQTSDVLPKRFRGNTRLMNVFMIRRGKSVIGYLVSEGDSFSISRSHISSLIRMLASVLNSHHVTQIQRNLNRKLLDLYTHDSLTELFNRFGLDDVGQAYYYTLKKSHNVQFWFVDIDNLKAINDSYGHHSGDVAIRGVAGVLRSIGDDNRLFAMRYGGDEFLLFGSADLEEIEDEIMTGMKGVRVEISARDGSTEHSIPVIVSIGTYQIDAGDPRSLEECIAEADQEMYKVKKQHKNRRDAV
ncbi:MAG: EAL domain-containing protein [Anaerovoracaceae bacterium]|jgi:diguanylate cyclase (GGDEF)-like protein